MPMKPEPRQTFWIVDDLARQSWARIGLNTRPGLKGFQAGLYQPPLAVVVGSDVFEHDFTHLDRVLKRSS